MRNIYLLLALIFFACRIQAQQIYIQEPIVAQLGCTSIPDLYSVSINNFQSTTVQSAMEVEISYTGNAFQKGLVAKGSLTGAPVFNLPPGLTRFSPSNINQFFPTRNLQFFDNKLQQINEQSACLPPGQYDICITLYGVDSKGNINLQNQLSKTCYKVTKENNNAVFLIAPANNEKVKMALPVFAWSPVANFSKSSNYIFEIVEVLEGQTAFEAFRSNPIYFSESGLKSNSFQFPIKSRQLLPCVNYAWRVGYYEQIGFSNPGFNVPVKPSILSEIWTFSYQCDNTKSSTTKSALNASRLIKPVQYANLLSTSGISFTWSEITPPQAYDITYMLRVVEKPMNVTALQVFNTMPPILSTPIVNNVFFSWAESAQFLDRSKTYVWGIIPYNSAQEQLIDNNLLQVNTFNFESNADKSKECPLKILDTRIISQNFNSITQVWEVKLARPKDNSEILLNDHVEVTIGGEIFYLAPNIGEIEITTNNPDLECNIINSTKDEITINIKSKANAKNFSKIGNTQICIQRRYASGELSCISKTCVNAKLDQIPEERPELTKFQVMQGFPKLNPDKSFTVQFDIASNVNLFPGWDFKTKKYDFLPFDKSILLEVVKADDRTHTYTCLLKDKTTLEIIDLQDVELPPLRIESNFNFEPLKRDNSESLIPIEAKDTSLVFSLSDFQKDDCLLSISKLRLFDPYKYVSTATYKLPKPKGDVSKYWWFQLNQDIDRPTNGARFPKYYQSKKRVEFTTLRSNVPLEFHTDIDGVGGNPVYILDPDWSAINADGNDPNQAYWEVKVCMSVDLLRADNASQQSDFDKMTKVCTDTDCMIISHNMKLAEEEEIEEICDFELDLFKANEPNFIESPMNIIEFAEGPRSQFFIYDFNKVIDKSKLKANQTIRENEVIFETIESNVPMAYTTLNSGSENYTAVPLWEESYDIVNFNQLYFKTYACLTLDLIENEGTPDEEFICSKDTCIIITYTGNNASIPGAPCSLEADFSYERDNELVTFNSTIKNKHPGHDLDYQWIFSDGNSARGESTTNLFTSIDSTWALLVVTGKDINGNTCTDTIRKSLKVIPNCNYQACNIPCGSPIASLTNDDEVKLCGQLIMKITSVSGNGSGFTGKGTVRIPWLLSDIEVEFSGIKVNADKEFCSGEINAVKDNSPTQLPQQWATNTGYSLGKSQAEAIDNHVRAKGIRQIPIEGALDGLEDEVVPLKVPIGFTNYDPDTGNTSNKTSYTLAIAGIKFVPGQNYIKAVAGVTLNDPDIGSGAQQLLFQSDNFFFNAARPIFNTGNSIDIAFRIIEDTRVKYGTSNTDPIYLIFKKNGNAGNSLGGTELTLKSECNQPYKFCMKVDVDIEMPKKWFTHIDETNTSNVKANAKFEMCDFKDIIAQISLPRCKIANTHGCELEVQQLTWDHNTSSNADGFAFPASYNEIAIAEGNQFKGFFLKSAKLILPEGLVRNDNSRIEVNLSNWIFHKGYGMTGSLLVVPNIAFPTMNVSDLGASIDTFRLEFVNNVRKEAYLKGEITLPVADYSENDPEKAMNKLVYKAIFGSYPPNTVTDGLLFQINPKNGLQSDFFGKGVLDVKQTSKLYIAFTKTASSVDLILNGKINWPNKEIAGYEIDMDLSFEQIKLNYSKPRGGEGTFLFDHGVWSFASPEKKVNKFSFNIENFKAVTELNVGAGKLFVGGIGFDAIINVNEKVGGAAAIKILGHIKKEQGQRLTSGFEGIKVDSIAVFANLAGAKIDGYVKFFNDNIFGKAIKGEVNAVFKGADISVHAGLLFGNKIDDPVPYKYMKLEATVTFPDPGVPFMPGFVFRGFGAGFYNNMEATFPTLETLELASNSSAFSGASFLPMRGSKGLSLMAIAATSPSEKTFNMDLALMGEINEDGGLNINVSAKAFGGAKISERYHADDKAWLKGFITGNFDFPNKLITIYAGIKIKYKKNDITYISSNDIGLDLELDGNKNTFYFAFGTAQDPNKVEILENITAQLYLMFGNTKIFKPTEWIGERTIQQRAALGLSSNFDGDKIEPSIQSSGKGFATGLSVEGSGNGEVDLGIGRLTYSFGAGAEFHLSMIDYGLNSQCEEISPVGFNGYYLQTGLTAWAFANGGINGNPMVELRALATLEASFPNPWKFNGGLYGSIEIGSLIELNVSLPLKFGKDCIITQPSVSNQVFSVENVAEDLYIFKDVQIQNGATGVDPHLPLRWNTFYNPGETFSLPEMQSDGTVKSRNFKVNWKAELFENKNYSNSNTQQLTKVEDRKIDIGRDSIGRWCMSKEIDKYGYELKVGLSNGISIDSLSFWIREEVIDKVLIGNFNGDNFDDVLYFTPFNSKWNILLSDGKRFYHVNNTNLSFLQNVSNIMIGHFNHDQLSDLTYKIGDNYFIRTSEGLVGNNINFSNEILAFSHNLYLYNSTLIKSECKIGDFNGDELSDYVFCISGLEFMEQNGGMCKNELGCWDQVLKYFVKLNFSNDNSIIFSENNLWFDKTERLVNINPSSSNSLGSPVFRVIEYDNQFGDDLLIGSEVLVSKFNPRRFDKLNSVNLPQDWWAIFDKNVEISSLTNINEAILNISGGLNIGKFNEDEWYDVISSDYNVDQFKCGSLWYPNFLTPNNEYKIVLNGEIIEADTLVKSEVITRHFTTGDSEELDNLIKMYAKDNTPFDSTVRPAAPNPISIRVPRPGTTSTIRINRSLPLNPIRRR